MSTTEVKEMVRNRYGGLAAGSAGCCGPATGSRDTSWSMGYSEAELASLPEGADLGLGCGNPQALAAMRSGEVVVDLGSGAGIDCFLAAQQVGPAGRVIGVDMTHEMLAKAELDIRGPDALGICARLRKHLVRHVDADHPAGGPDLLGGKKAIDAGAAAKIDNHFPRTHGGQRLGITATKAEIGALR